MNKLIFAVVFLSFTFSVQAHHHRGHALYYLERADAELQNALGQIKGVRDTNEEPLHPEAEGTLEVITTRIELMQSQLVLVEEGLRDCEVNLKDVRRMVNQPKVLFLGNPHATLFVTKLTTYATGSLIAGQDIENEKFLGDLVRVMASYWQDLDTVLWHINDAINEEIYQDDVWFGHAPGFDPVTNLGMPHSRSNQIEHTEERHWVICN